MPSSSRLPGSTSEYVLCQRDNRVYLRPFPSTILTLFLFHNVAGPESVWMSHGPTILTNDFVSIKLDNQDRAVITRGSGKTHRHQRGNKNPMMTQRMNMEMFTRENIEYTGWLEPGSLVFTEDLLCSRPVLWRQTVMRWTLEKREPKVLEDNFNCSISVLAVQGILLKSQSNTDAL